MKKLAAVLYCGLNVATHNDGIIKIMDILDEYENSHPQWLKYVNDKSSVDTLGLALRDMRKLLHLPITKHNRGKK